VGGSIAGVIDIESSVEGAFDENWIAVLSYIADLAGISLALEATKQTEQSAFLKALSRLVNELSHHISTPLQVIKLQVETLTSKELGPEVPELAAARIKERLQAIERNVETIAQVRDELRDISRDIQLRKSRFDVFNLLDTCCREFKSELAEKHIKLTVSERGPGGLETEGDPNLLGYSIQCLLQNAIEAIEKRRKKEGAAASGRITIGVESPDQNRILIIVQDTGIGIDPEDRKRLFEPLFTTKQKQEPGGMGLFSVKRVVTLHGGSIFEASDPGEGARFTITLPRG
jgi:signal transduction histidine kinase